jgi:galactofuranosylgalactofuranosylrhamnosyl-N-acetylglucosaminyl-diphospho-decaprenol beta-1,5/1,6-galactofuranosyltransferase
VVTLGSGGVSEGAATTVLQHVDLEGHPATQELYFRYDWNDSAKLALLAVEDWSLSIDAGLRVSFGTYFNSFYVTYWSECTSVSSVALRLQLAGRGVVSVFWQAAEGSVRLLGEIPFDSPTATTVEMSLCDDEGRACSTGRVWFEVEARTDTTLYAGEWVTPDPPVRRVNPSVVICTFNRVEYLSSIMQALAERKDVYQEISRFFIVNQGEHFGLADLVTATGQDFLDRIELIEQDNLGGCGGFTRGMYETLRDGSLTHAILLDDDVRLHPESLFRAIRFMAYAHDDVVLGGHMLDLVRPRDLYEAGADFDSETLLPKPVGQGLRLNNPRNLDEFLTVRPVDYNGWWFFMAATSVIEHVGLPIPCFIRGDDMEYGVRLARNGLKTIPIPGIAVWHEPFYLKLGNWHYYFEVRNRLTMLSLHHNGDLKAVRRKIRRRFHFDAMLSRYNSCQFAIDGLRDYLAGAERAFDTTNTALLHCLEHQKAIGPRRVDGRAKATSRRFGSYRRLASMWTIPIVRVARLVLPVSKRPARVLRGGRDHVVPWRPLVFHRYRFVEDHDQSVWEFQRNPKLERRQFVEFERLIRKLELTFSDDAVDTSAGMPWLGWWRRQFEHDGDVARS